MKTISLYYKDGSSDKEYHAQISDGPNPGEGYTVNFQYGRRGSTLTSGTKTQSPVTYAQAEKIFDKLVKEKKAKGYTEGEAGTPYVGGDKAERVSEYNVQLLNPIDDLKHIINDDNWCAQEKYDGKCMLLRYYKGNVTAINKLGLECGAPWKVMEEFARSLGRGSNEHVIHGECVGDTFYAFDVLVFNGIDIRNKGYLERHSLLNGPLGLEIAEHIVFAPVVLRFKKRFVESLKAAGKEGAVFKRIDAPYKAGRPNSGGSQLKYKFVESATVRVGKVNAKRSVTIQVEGPGAELIDVGNVTIPPNHAIPRPSEFVEVQYLYAYPGGSLYQPVYKGVRDDKTEADQASSLKYKGKAKEVNA